MTQVEIKQPFKAQYQFEVTTEACAVQRDEFSFPNSLKVVSFAINFEVDDRRWVGLFGDPYSARLKSIIMTSPNANEVFVVAGGHGVRIDSRNPEAWQELEVFPVVDSAALAAAGVVVFADFTTLCAYDVQGLRWRTDRISTDGVRIRGVDGDVIFVTAWDGAANKDVNLSIEIDSGTVTRL